MLLEKSSVQRPAADQDEARLVIDHKVTRVGTKAEIQPLFYEEVKRHSARTELQLKQADGTYKAALKRI